MRYLFTDTRGGVSNPPYQSLNLSYGVGDDPDCVHENRYRVKRQLGVEVLVSARQVHGHRIFWVEEPITEDLELDGYDALVTNRTGVGLLVQLADCQGVLLHDPVTPAVAAVHAGWRGSAVNIVGRTVAAMQERYGSVPASMVALISPSLGPCCAEFVHYRTELPEDFRHYQVDSGYFDFWSITRDQLVGAGLDGGHIRTSGICTSCSPGYFSYRRSCRQGTAATGRQGASIVVC